MNEAGKKIQALSEEMKRTIDGILAPGQLERLRGIALQMAGVSALDYKEVQQDLKLSDDQVAQIKAAKDHLMTKMGKLLGESTDPKTRQSKMRELHNYEKQVMGILTSDQEALLDKMKGENIQIPAH